MKPFAGKEVDAFTGSGRMPCVGGAPQGQTGQGTLWPPLAAGALRWGADEGIKTRETNLSRLC